MERIANVLHTLHDDPAILLLCPMLFASNYFYTLTAPELVFAFDIIHVIVGNESEREGLKGEKDIGN